MATIAALTPWGLAGTLCLGWVGLAGTVGGHDESDQRPRFQKLGVVSDA